MGTSAAPIVLPGRAERVGVRWLRSWTARVGLALCTLVVLLAFAGPLLAPHSPTEIVTRAYAPAGDSGLVLGSDYLGRDVLSRVMSGGRQLILLPLLATVVAYLIGGVVALTAAVTRSRLGEAVMRAVDVLLVFPGLLLMLVLVTGLGEGIGTLLFGIVLLQIPSVARIFYAATIELSGRGYVEAALARGESMRYLIARELLPNISGPLAADFGPRLIASVFLIASLAFLGFGATAPDANWALMVTENRAGILINGLAVFAPVVAIATMTIGVSLVSDAIAHSIGATDEDAA